MLDWKDTKKLEEVVSLEQLYTLNSNQLTKLIKKQKDTLKSLGPKLADKGEKIRNHLEKLQDALSTVKAMEMEVDNVGLSLEKLNLDSDFSSNVSVEEKKVKHDQVEEKKVKHDHLGSNEFIRKQNKYKTWQKKAPTLFISFEESAALVKAKELEYQDYLPNLSKKKDTTVEKIKDIILEEKKEKNIKIESKEDTIVLSSNEPKQKKNGIKKKKVGKKKKGKKVEQSKSVA